MATPTSTLPSEAQTSSHHESILEPHNSAKDEEVDPKTNAVEVIDLEEEEDSDQTAVSNGASDPAKDSAADPTTSPVDPTNSAKENQADRMTSSTKKPIPEVCANCLSVATEHCKRCKSSWYCSRECQSADWIYHRFLCRQFSDFKDRPDSTCVRAIFFPENDRNPRFVWLKQKEEALDLDYVDEKFEVEELLGISEEETIEQQYVMRSTRRNRWTEKDKARMYLLDRKRALADGSKPNVSIGTVTQGNFHFSWRGPVVAVLTKSDDSEQSDSEPTVDDMGMVDFRDLIDFFALYGQWGQGYHDFGVTSFWWTPGPLTEELQQQRQVQAVKVMCDVECKMTGRKYVPCPIYEGHPAMALLQPCPVTALLGLPLLMRRLPPDEPWKDEAESSGNKNAGPGLLLLDVNPKSRFWGTARNLREVAGGMLVMRQDLKELHPFHVEAMLLYLLNVVCPAMEDSIKGQREKGEVLEIIHPSRLDWFFKSYQKKRAEKEDDWKNVPPLFEVSATSTTMIEMSQTLSLIDI
ncbi:MAG: hypothetical protein Q9166_002336 [cf. Caloplaca sp. 2 TL-2023]